jgi:hypothetical protein
MLHISSWQVAFLQNERYTLRNDEVQDEIGGECSTRGTEEKYI